MDVKNKSGSILISGGSRGLGLFLVTDLLEKGYQVSTFSRQKTPGIDILIKKYPQTFIYKDCDATDNKKLISFIDEIEKKHQGLYALVNNAALGQDQLFLHLAEKDIDQIISVNFKSLIMLTKFVLKKMFLQNTAGRIINISSICASRGYSGLSVYSATKAAIEGLTRSLARELGERKIAVNAVAPGFFASQMSDALSQGQLQTITKRTPSGKLTTPDDISHVVSFLLFNDCNITGQVITVDGGITS